MSHDEGTEPRRVLVDGNNVMGAAADGWWRDPPRAVRKLLDRLICYARVTSETIELVLDVPQPNLVEGNHHGVIVRYAARKGRDAGDDRLVQLLEDDEEHEVEVITSDRKLAHRARRRGAQVTGAGTFLARLEEAGC